MKKRVVIFGSTDTGQRIYEDIKESMDVLFYVDEDSRKWGTVITGGVMVKSPDELSSTEYDYIYIGVLTYYAEVVKLLDDMKVPKEKIISRYVEIPTYARIECLKNIRQLLDEENITAGAAAELGVYQGDFAKVINHVFSDRILYLFDTFEGFSSQDCRTEMERGYMAQNKTGYFSNTTEQMVVSKMDYPEMCRLRKGIFPQSAAGMEEAFCFVNLDADLYAPTMAGLEYFYPRMVDGGMILVHDYFSKAFLGVRDAVRKYCSENRIKYAPIGDTLSIVIRKCN